MLVFDKYRIYKVKLDFRIDLVFLRVYRIGWMLIIYEIWPYNTTYKGNFNKSLYNFRSNIHFTSFSNNIFNIWTKTTYIYYA